MYRQEEAKKQAAAGEHQRHRSEYNRRLRATQSPNLTMILMYVPCQYDIDCANQFDDL